MINLVRYYILHNDDLFAHPQNEKWLYQGLIDDNYNKTRYVFRENRGQGQRSDRPV